MATLFSLLSGRRLRNDTALTGEVTLRGTVLPVGGIKEKLIAAFRAGVSRVVIPARNEKNLRDLPEVVRNGLEVNLVHRVEEVLSLVVEGGFTPEKGSPLLMQDEKARADAYAEMATELLTSHL